ncbi:MAG TPA: hypothetical protein GX501_04590 [Clostridiaceae bacterium]|nr:hypothetical protein [Clostridiaceae bacterium]
MNSNIEKILSLSAGVLLFGIALAVFFTSYSRHMDYVNGSAKALEEDMMIGISWDAREIQVTGSEVIHMVIELKNHKEITELQSLYSYGTAIPFDEMPEIWADGMNAESLDHAEIDPEGSYHVSYDTDPDGNIIRINYSLR